MNTNIIDQIFPDGIKAEDYTIADSISIGLKDNNYKAWEKAGILLNNSGRLKEGSHCLRVSHGIQKVLKKHGNL